MTGESYAGQYLPNIAHFILNTEPFHSKINLKGMALGNACWGGNATHVECNGPNSRQNMASGPTPPIPLRIHFIFLFTQAH